MFKYLIEKSLSKYDQTSNWSVRPLRLAHLHYAAMDAFVLVKLFLEFKEKLEKQVAET